MSEDTKSWATVVTEAMTGAWCRSCVCHSDPGATIAETMGFHCEDCDPDGWVVEVVDE